MHSPWASTVSDTNLSSRRYALLRRLALACALAVLTVTSLSAYMRLSKAGLGCGDWPACYGQQQRAAAQGLAAPPSEAGGIAAARLVHRVMAVVVLLTAMVMLMLCFDRKAPMRSEGVLALLILLLALSLAVLGRWSSGVHVPAVALGNLLGGFAMLALCARLSVAGWIAAWPRLRGWAWATAGLLLLQLSLGGLVSASFAGLSCTPGSDCSLWAAWQQSGWQSLDPWREPLLNPPPAVNPAGMLVHSLHRHLAWLIAPALLGLAWLAWHRGRKRSAAVLAGLLGMQLLAGILLVLLGLPLALALLHNLLAALLLATLVTLI